MEKNNSNNTPKGNNIFERGIKAGDTIYHAGYKEIEAWNVIFVYPDKYSPYAIIQRGNETQKIRSYDTAYGLTKNEAIDNDIAQLEEWLARAKKLKAELQ